MAFRNSLIWNKKNRRRGNLPQRLALVMAVLAFIFVAAGWLLNRMEEGVPAGPMGGLSPKNGQKIWIKDGESIRFEWANALEDGTVLEVSRDRGFNDLVLREVSPKSPLLRELPSDGEYFYRFVPPDSEQTTDPVTFTVVNPSPPILIYPFNPTVATETKTLRFYWQSKSGVAHYRFQIGFDAGFASLFTDLLLNETQTTPINLPPGDFFWRVRGEDTPQAVSQWSESRSLRIERPHGQLTKDAPKEPVPELPVELKEPPPKVADSKTKSKKAPVVKSPPLPAPPEVRVAVVKPKTPAPPVAKKSKPTAKPAKSVARVEERAKPVVKSKPKPPARTVAAVSTPAPPPPAPVPVVQLPTPPPPPSIPVPKLQLPPDGVSIVTMNGTQDPISFRWKSAGPADQYRLEISADAKFKNVVHSTVTGDPQLVVVKPLPKGKLFWRVRAEQGTNKSDWSAPYGFEFSK